MKTPELIEEIKHTMFDWYSFDLTNEQVIEIMDNVTIDGGMDTVDREMVASFLSKKIVGRDWPCNGDSEEYKDKFYKDFAKGAKKHNYKTSIK